MRFYLHASLYIVLIIYTHCTSMCENAKEEGGIAQ